MLSRTKLKNFSSTNGGKISSMKDSRLNITSMKNSRLYSSMKDSSLYSSMKDSRLYNRRDCKFIGSKNGNSFGSNMHNPLDKFFSKKFLKTILAVGLIFSLLASSLGLEMMGGLFGGLKPAEAGTSIQSENVTGIGPGVTYRKAYAQLNGAPEAINMVNIDLTNEYIKLRTSAPNDRPIGLETVSSQAKRQTGPGNAVVAAVNGDFFYLSDPAGLPIGMQIRNGEILSGPSDQAVFGVTSSGTPFIDMISMQAVAQTVGEHVYSRAINSVNKRRLNDLLVLYTPSFGPTTKTNSYGTELVLTDVEQPIKPNKQYTGTVLEKRIGVGSAKIPSNGVVLSGHGTAAAFLNSFQPGQQINFSVNISKQDVEQAIGGITRPVVNGKLAPASELAKLDMGMSRQPRTAVGIKGNQVLIVTVDGRQPGVSAGMTLLELGQFMIDMGMEQVINFDGGGSTTFVVRNQGDSMVSIGNRPSDGKERYVSNSLQVVSVAPQGALAKLMITPGTSKIVANSKEKFFLKGIDEYFNPMDVSDRQVLWSVDPGLGTIDEQGIFTAASTAATGNITANIDGVLITTQVNVVDKVSRIALYPNPVIVEPGKTARLTATAYDEQGHPIILNTGGVKWSEIGGTGTIDSTGLFTAGDKLKEGIITATVGNLTTNVKVYTGRPPVIIEDFEDISEWKASQLKAAAFVTSSGVQDPKQDGLTSGKLFYNFEGYKVKGTSAAYMLRSQRLVLEGKPIRLGMWVYGDAKGHWLRAIYYNGSGKKCYLDFAPKTGVNWNGWKYVTAAFPATEQLPISLESIYVAEDRVAKKDKGVVYCDNLTAEYTENTAGLIPAISVKIPNPDGTTSTIEVPVEQGYKGESGRFLVQVDLKQLSLYNMEKNKVSLYKVMTDGTRKIQRTNYIASENKIKALVDGLGVYELVENDPIFGDLNGSSRFGWAKNDIEIMAAKEIVKGRGNSLFVPDAKVTRAEFLAMLVRAMGLKTNTAKKSGFKDVRTGDWYLETIQAAVQGGLTHGYSDGTFQPNKKITRLEMAVLLSRASRLSGEDKKGNVKLLQKYTDYDSIPEWAKQDLSLAVEQGLIQGKEKNKLVIHDLGNRAEATVLVKRYFESYGVPKL